MPFPFPTCLWHMQQVWLHDHEFYFDLFLMQWLLLWGLSSMALSMSPPSALSYLDCWLRQDWPSPSIPYQSPVWCLLLLQLHLLGGLWAVLSEILGDRTVRHFHTTIIQTSCCAIKESSSMLTLETFLLMLKPFSVRAWPWLKMQTI